MHWIVLLLLISDWPSFVARLSAAAPIVEEGELHALRSELKQPSSAREHYTLAYIDRTLAFAAGTSDELRRELLDEATVQLERAIALEPRNADAHALLGSVFGASTGVHRGRAAELGRRARESLARALELEPYNPRVHLLLGSSAFYRPAEFGGGAEKAEPHLRKALALFANEPKTKPWPNWGRFETHLLLGQTMQKLGRNAAAREQYEAALALAPRSEYVRSILRKVTR